MTLDVVWLTYDPESIPRGYWDQAVLEALLLGSLWPLGRFDGGCVWHQHPSTVAPGRGAVVVVPGRFNAGHVDRLLADCAHLRWMVLAVTSDEERLFPVEAVEAGRPDAVIWLQTPTAADLLHARGRWHTFGVGYSPGTRNAALAHRDLIAAKPDPWFFSGQMTHPRRREAGAVLQRIANSERRNIEPGQCFYATPGFTQGMPKPEYLERMARAIAAPAPSGPVTPDTFRAWEALELGAVPLLDLANNAGPNTYWPDAGWPLPTLVEDWRTAPDLLTLIEHEFPRMNAHALAWWIAEKRTMATNLERDLLEQGAPDTRMNVNELITVIVPTSPIPSHPSTAVLHETLLTVRDHLPTAEIIITADVHPGQPRHADDYAEYLWRMVLSCHLDWGRTLPVLMDRHQHQTGMLHEALRLVRTPLVLYVEHDTPLTPDRPIEWGACASALLGNELDLIRFHHEALILDDHLHLMPDGRNRSLVSGAPIARTVQWSQRPHLARTDYYRRIAAEHLRQPGRMIEDVMHSVVESAWLDDGEEGYRRHRLGLYAPDGDIKRSYHLDGRRALAP